MIEKDEDGAGADHDLIIDRIYQVALEPTALNDFIDLWHDMDWAPQFAGAETSEDTATPFQGHLERAQSILQRDDTARPDLAAYLLPYNNLAAFVVSGDFMIEAANPGAQSAFGVQSGDTLDQLGVPPELRASLIGMTRDVLHKTEYSEKLLKAELATKGGAMLFRVMQIPQALADGPAALIVSTHFYWREAISALLRSVFHLTAAERDVVRMLVEGEDTRFIAAQRATSEGTVRVQIKSILGKMNVRSQTDIVRLVMMLGEFPKGHTGQDETAELTSPAYSNWLESEVWKPFKHTTLPDGRTLTYHDMGPPIGHPVLLSHMGSCMARWSRSMIQMAFERNLRVICPIRAGYGHSDGLDPHADPLATASRDAVFLLNSLGISHLPFVVQGTDFPFAADLVARQPGLVSEVIGLGARPSLPGGVNVGGNGRWQRFFVSTAQNAPHLVQFASRAVMAMSRRIGPEAMLRQLCKDSPADQLLLETEEMKQVLVANISLMAGESTNAARAFAMEYSAFQEDLTDRIMTTRDIPVQIFLADQDPTIDVSAIPVIKAAYPWITIEVERDAGLALMFQRAEKLIPLMFDAAKRAASSG